MKNKKSDFKEISISLKKIQDCKFYYNLDFKCNQESLKEDKLPYNVIVKYFLSYELEEDLFYINISIIYEEKDNPILEAENRFTFHIKELKKLIKVQSSTSFALEVDFLPTLINVAIGTMRGIIFSRTGSSSLSDYPLPMISMNELTPTDQ
ncbi:hypothetical protein [Macellibacteroides fermentans]|uniref:Uncharacterized protein n=1 Tax=Macellibacteroides fermentans TaxID=879969 RepID=A0A8E2D5N8_9PORP|nr:hypothetical protein [Macellibacteroides fermentans]NYI49970.1 hypothetical protein [Macellibacteroides fermentans]